MQATLQINEVKGGYSPRTKANAKFATVTIAVAVDYTTYGEKLTKKLAGVGYIAIPYEKTQKKSAREMLLSSIPNRKAIFGEELFSVNIAGNGIYTLAKHGIAQEEADAKIYSLLKFLHSNKKIAKIYTGLQTGIDLAGARAALNLGIPLEINMPENFLMRNSKGEDLTNSIFDIMEILNGKNL